MAEYLNRLSDMLLAQSRDVVRVERRRERDDSTRGLLMDLTVEFAARAALDHLDHRDHDGVFSECKNPSCTSAHELIRRSRDWLAVS